MLSKGVAPLCNAVQVSCNTTVRRRILIKDLPLLSLYSKAAHPQQDSLKLRCESVSFPCACSDSNYCLVKLCMLYLDQVTRAVLGARAAG